MGSSVLMPFLLFLGFSAVILLTLYYFFIINNAQYILDFREMEAAIVAQLQKDREFKVLDHLYHSTKRAISAHVQNSVTKDIIYVLPDHVDSNLLVSEETRSFYCNQLIKRLSAEGFFAKRLKTDLDKCAIYINWVQSYRQCGVKSL